MKKSELKKLIREELLKESKGIKEADKQISKWRADLFKKLNDDELWDFGHTMCEFFKDYK